MMDNGGEEGGRVGDEPAVSLVVTSGEAGAPRVPVPLQLNGGIRGSETGNLSIPSPGGLFPLPPSASQAVGSATGNPRNKVALQKGFSLMDWVRLTKSKDLSGMGGPRVNGKIREITRMELRKHKKRQDAWMALNGQVYNVTAYMDFHPGGWDELMKGAGKDATALFNEVHRWVNYESMLSSCLIGKLVEGGPSLPPPPPSTTSLTAPSTPPKPVIPPIAQPVFPAWDFFQTDKKITIIVYTRRKGISPEDIIVDNFLDSFRVSCFLPDCKAFILHYQLAHRVLPGIQVKVGVGGKVDIELTKEERGLRWSGLGTPLHLNNWFGDIKEMKITYRRFRVKLIEKTTHDTRYLVMEPIHSSHFVLKPGHHVHIKSDIEGMEIQRSYTPVLPLNLRSNPGTELHFLIKIYQDGAFTPLIGALRPGDELNLSDHTGSFNPELLRTLERLYLITAGTGVTPILSMLPFIGNKLRTTFLNFNKTEQDIIWRAELEEFAASNSWLELVHVLSDQPGYGGLQGRIRKDLLDPVIEPKVQRRLACICGPGAFSSETERILLEEFSFEPDEIHLFVG